jgi:hypothetical protein
VVREALRCVLVWLLLLLVVLVWYNSDTADCQSSYAELCHVGSINCLTIGLTGIS